LKNGVLNAIVAALNSNVVTLNAIVEISSLELVNLNSINGVLNANDVLQNWNPEKLRMIVEA